MEVPRDVYARGGGGITGAVRAARTEGGRSAGIGREVEAAAPGAKVKEPAESMREE